jgi:Ner family transcriptional regulator
MNVLNETKKTAQADWHRADVIAALHKKGWSMRELSKQNGYSAGTLTTALDKPYLSAEKIIAAALGIAPELIWPTRYEKRNFTPVLTLVPISTSAQLKHFVSSHA